MLRKIGTVLLAFFHISDRAVCEASRGKHDFHDYPDSVFEAPFHFHNHVCKRCGKVFEI